MDIYGERMTVTGDDNDLRFLAAAGRIGHEVPFDHRCRPAA